MAFERNENMNEFEEFLKESSDEFQMSPSNRVWNAVQNELHTTPKWPYYTLTIIFISLGILTNIYQNQKSQSVNIASSKVYQEVSPDQRSVEKHALKDATADIRISKEFIAKNKTIGRSINPFSVSVPEKVFSAVTERKNIEVQNSGIPQWNRIYSIAMPEENTRRELSFKKEFMMRQPNLYFDNSITSTLENPKQSFKISGELNSKKISLATLSKKQSKTAWSLYFSPAVSYRKLRGSAQAFNNYSYTRTDVNSAVRHLPMMGMELGSSLIFNPQKKIRFKIGLQFNLNQYDIRAYSAIPEVTSLSVSGIGQAPIKTIAYHRNFDGFKETWLKNKHIMMSIPMATEIRVMGDRRISLNIAAGIQPTYMLSENPYLISSNLKNYAKAPSGLLRNLNVNGSLESFISFKSGNMRWTMGPQFRYQLLSNFKKTYPFTEHLTDFGFKVGVIKSFN